MPPRLERFSNLTKLRLISKIIKRIVVTFFVTTILAVVALRFIPVYYTPLMFIRLAQMEKPKLSHHWVPLRKMSTQMPLAVIASEDQRFMEHHGFDFEAIKAAVERNRKQPEKNRLGGSTISQQTAKNVFLWPGRSWVRKGLEAYFTVLIELCWPKERIMEVYLNSIETGPGIYGVEAVAQEHFGTTAANLNGDQCALIAATLPNPRRFSSASPSNYMQKRQQHIRRQMHNVSFEP